MMGSPKTSKTCMRTLERSWTQVSKRPLLNKTTFKLEKKKKKIINMDNTQEVKPVVSEKSEDAKVDAPASTQATQPASSGA